MAERKARTDSVIDPERLYRVKVRRAVRLGKHGTIVMTPMSENLVRGKVLATIPAEDIESSEPV